jgi:hypothetical protein
MPALKDHSYIYLLIGLVSYLLIIPILDDYTGLPATALRLIAFTLVLMVGLWTLQVSRLWFICAIVLAVTSLAANITALNLDGKTDTFAALLLFFAFLGVVLLVIVKHLFSANRLTINRLVGAICVYMLIGIQWSLLYNMLSVVSPEAFAVNNPINSADTHEWLYYSFVTLSTLGYGDITPLSATGRALAYMEAIVGQFYIAILVAGFVGAYIAENSSSD